jgi:hypothetical protein
MRIFIYGRILILGTKDINTRPDKISQIIILGLTSWCLVDLNFSTSRYQNELKTSKWYYLDIYLIS